MKTSIITIQKRVEEGYPSSIHYGDIIINGTSLYERIGQEFDFVSCLGWGDRDFQEKHHPFSRRQK